MLPEINKMNPDTTADMIEQLRKEYGDEYVNKLLSLNPTEPQIGLPGDDELKRKALERIQKMNQEERQFNK